MQCTANQCPIFNVSTDMPATMNTNNSNLNNNQNMNNNPNMFPQDINMTMIANNNPNNNVNMNMNNNLNSLNLPPVNQCNAMTNFAMSPHNFFMQGLIFNLNFVYSLNIL